MPRNRKGSGSENYPSSMIGWENDDGSIGGYIKLTPDLIEELLDLYEEGDEYVVDSYDEGYAQLSFYLADNGDNYLGSAKIPEPSKQGKKKRRSR